MNDTWLIQRLCQPHPTNAKGDFLHKADAIFGGGNLHLSKEAAELMRSIFSFDYMGAAEFEWGAVPKALQTMAKSRAQLIAFEYTLLPEYIRPSYWRELKARRDRRIEIDKAKAEGKRTPRAKKTKSGPERRRFFIICREDHASYVRSLIEKMAQGTQRLKEGARFEDILDPEPGRHPCSTVGWLELDNRFFFTIDKAMWRKTCQLFEIKQQVELEPEQSAVG